MKQNEEEEDEKNNKKLNKTKEETKQTKQTHAYTLAHLLLLFFPHLLLINR